MGENARRDLKEGLVLYNTDNNAGLRDAWNTIQEEVGLTGRTAAIGSRVPCGRRGAIDHVVFCSGAAVE